MPTMDTTMARDLLMLSQRLMPSMVTMDMDTFLAMVMVMDMSTMDTMDTHMPTTDTTMARDLLMLRLMPMLTTDTTHMLMDTMDTTDMPTTVMPTMDTMDTHMLMDTTDIINLFIFVKDLRSLLCEMGCS